MELSKTQRQVLQILSDNKKECLDAIGIKNKSGNSLNISHINAAIKNFLGNDLVYLCQDGKVQISPNGESALHS